MITDQGGLAAEPLLALPSRELNEPHSTQKSYLPIFTSNSEHHLCHPMNTALGASLRVLLFLHSWTLSQSFSLFGWGDAAVHLPAGLAESPLVPFGTQVGTVPTTSALRLPVPCNWREKETGYKRKCQTP